MIELPSVFSAARRILTVVCFLAGLLQAEGLLAVCERHPLAEPPRCPACREGEREPWIGRCWRVLTFGLGREYE